MVNKFVLQATDSVLDLYWMLLLCQTRPNLVKISLWDHTYLKFTILYFTNELDTRACLIMAIQILFKITIMKDEKNITAYQLVLLHLKPHLKKKKKKI